MIIERPNTELVKKYLDLVNDVAKVNINGKKVFNFYSFATKYCSHHKPIDYPIYDSYVEKLFLMNNAG